MVIFSSFTSDTDGVEDAFPSIQGRLLNKLNEMLVLVACGDAGYVTAVIQPDSSAAFGNVIKPFGLKSPSNDRSNFRLKSQWLAVI